MKDIIIGASGFIGHALYSTLIKKGQNIVGTFYSRKKDELIKLDMMSKDDIVTQFTKFEPKTVYIPAFIPNVDKCENDQEIQNINENGIKNIIDTCKEFSSKPVFFSSDYVFDGLDGPYLETNTPNPLNQYGKIKLSCENMVRELENYLIIRTTVVYGYDLNSKNFLMTLIQNLNKNVRSKIPIDQLGSPSYVKDLVRITIDLVNKKKKGIYNIAGPDYCSRYTFALKIARTFGLDESLIQPVTTKELNQIAQRPLKGGLIIDKIRTEIDAKPLGIDNVLYKLKKKIVIQDNKDKNAQ